jgi:hypothetical protein
MTRTATRAGRAGAESDRKSRTVAVWWQNGQPSGSAGDSQAGPGATGASHRGHASVPVASRPALAARRSSKCLIGSRSSMT